MQKCESYKNPDFETKIRVGVNSVSGKRKTHDFEIILPGMGVQACTCRILHEWIFNTKFVKKSLW